jgi:isopenicillin-N N-acyltransferase like protein
VRVLELPRGTPRAQGQAHGEAFRSLIAELAAIRLALTRAYGGFADEGEVLSLAEAHLPVLAAFDADLHAELLGVAEGAAVTPAQVVVLNHYTDLRDLAPTTAPEDGCSAVWARTPAGPVLGQTWDMHASATPYVGMLGVPAQGGRPGAWVFTITGCLGMAGLNDAGLGVTINNLRSRDARVGVVWPALVRRVLREVSAEVAHGAILAAPVGSGHHYLVADGRSAYGIETSGALRSLVFRGERDSYVHTNHCFDAEVAEQTRRVPGSTTHDRLRVLGDDLGARPVTDVHDLWARLGSHAAYPRAVCTHMASPEAPHATNTCGALAMDLERRVLWAAAGCVHRSRPHVFEP